MFYYKIELKILQQLIIFNNVTFYLYVINKIVINLI